MQLANVLPEFATEVAAALEAEGFSQLRATVFGAKVERWTWDMQVSAGYIYLVQLTPLHHSETPAAETIAFAAPHWFNVDLRNNGEILGIELLGRREIIARLEAARAA